MTPRRTCSLLPVATAIILALLCLATLLPSPTLARPFDGRAAEMSERYGINFELSKCLNDNHIEYVDAMRNKTHVYFEASQGDNMRFHWHPTAIVYPRTTQQVSGAVQCAAKQNIQTVARSGGHAFSGYSSGGQDGAMIVDFREMDSIQSDSANALVHIEPAARLGDVVKALWADDKRAMPHGTCPTVGVGGHSLCGGVGPTSRHWGLATDNMVELEMVKADGQVIHVSQHENPDLFWAMRGAGVYYGLVTRFTFSTYKADQPVTYVRYRWDDSIASIDDAVKIMQAVQEFGQHPDLPSELGFHVQVMPVSWTSQGKGNLAMQLRGMYLGDKETYTRDVAPHLWQAMAKQGRPEKADAMNEDQMDYLDLLKTWDDFGAPDDKLDTQAERKHRNNFVSRTSLAMGQQGFTDKGFRTILEDVWQTQADQRAAGRAPEYAWNLYFELFGGQKNRMRDPDLVAQSAFAHRDGLWLMQASTGGLERKPLAHEAYATVHRMDTAVQRALEVDGLGRMGYSCYADPTLDDWQRMYYGDSIKRMVELKRNYDPTNLFRNPQSLIETPRTLVTGLKQWLLSPHPLP